MLLQLLFFLLLWNCFSEDEFCKFKIGSKQFDLTPLKGVNEIDMSNCGERYHTMIFDICEEIGSSECPSTDTTGPGNACDAYTPSSYQSYYWVGSDSSSKVTFPTTYEDRKFKIIYTGKLQTEKSPQWTRSLELDFTCDYSAMEPEFSCNGIEQHQSSTMYKMGVKSNKACPVDQNPSAGFWFVNYGEKKCSQGEIASYFEPICFTETKDSSFDFYCDGNMTYVNLYNNEDCSGTPVSKDPIGQIGTCFSDQFGVYTSVYCTDGYELGYENAKFFLPKDGDVSEFSSENQVVGELYFPTNGDCVPSLYKPNEYVKATCVGNFMATIYTDSGCNVPKESIVVYPGQIKNMADYFLGENGDTYYSMFVECEKK